MTPTYATPEQIQSGVPIRLTLEILAPQNGSTLDQAATLVEVSTSYGSVTPEQIQGATQHLAEHLGQIGSQQLQQFQQSQKMTMQQNPFQWGRQSAAGGSGR